MAVFWSGESRACGAAVPRYEGRSVRRSCLRAMSGGRGGSHAKHSNGLGSQINRQREARPNPCQTQTKRSGELANQEHKMRRSLRKTFPKKLLTVYQSYPILTNVDGKRSPSQKPFDASLSFADPAAGLFSSGPAVSAGRRGFHTPPLHPRRPRFPFRVSLVNPRSLELLDAQLCAFGVMLSPCGTMRATMKGVPNGEDVQIARGLP